MIAIAWPYRQHVSRRFGRKPRAGVNEAAAALCSASREDRLGSLECGDLLSDPRRTSREGFAAILASEDGEAGE